MLFEAAIESQSDMFKWMPWCHPDYSLNDSEEFISKCEEAWEDKTTFAFAIFKKSSDRFLGGVGLNQISLQNNFANLGYWVRSGQRNRGIATAAVRLLSEFGFEELGLTRIEIVIAVGNVASERVAENAGALREGVLRNRIILHNVPHDAVMYSLVPI